MKFFFCIFLFAQLGFVIENSVKSVDLQCKEWLNFQMILFILDDCDNGWIKNLSNDQVYINFIWVMEFLACGQKIGLILTKKKLLGFKEIGVVCVLTVKCQKIGVRKKFLNINKLIFSKEKIIHYFLKQKIDFEIPILALFVDLALCQFTKYSNFLEANGLRTLGEEISFTAGPKIYSHSQTFRYVRPKHIFSATSAQIFRFL